MIKQRNHGVFFVHYYHYLVTAYDARNRTAEKIAANQDSMPAEALITIVFSALGIEAFINELAEMAQRDADMAQRYESELRSMGQLRELAARLTALENTHEQVQRKYQAASEVLRGRPFDQGSQPFQDFRDLMQLRDALVHPRHRDTTDRAGHISSSHPVVRRLQQMGYSRTRGRQPDDIPGGMSWLNELETTRPATWSYRAACNMVTAVGNMLPGDETTTLGIQFMKDKIAQLPTVEE
jgi:hypothetical protein